MLFFRDFRETPLYEDTFDYTFIQFKRFGFPRELTFFIKDIP